MKIPKFSLAGSPIDRRGFLTRVGHGVGLATLASMRADAQTLAPPTNVHLVSGSAPAPVPAGMLQQSDFRYLGCMRMPAGVDTQFSYGGLTGRMVGGQLRLFVFGRNTSGA